MYGIFYITKNKTTKVLYFFKIKDNNLNANTQAIRIFNFNNIKNFPTIIIEKLQKTVDNFKLPWKLYYKLIKNNIDLSKTMQELNIDKEDIENPLIEYSNLDLMANSLLNTQFKEYER